MFALHPVHVMSVAWITELKNVLSGLFFLAALLSYLRFCDLDGSQSVHSSSRRRFYLLAMALYLCALFSKTSTSILPVAILLILWWKKGRVEKRDGLALSPLFALGAGLGLFTAWIEKYHAGARGAEWELSFLERCLIAGRALWFYAGKLLWPYNLSFIYPRWKIDATAAWQYLFPLSAIALLATLWWARRWLGRAPFAAMVYFTLAFPALVLVEVLYMMRYTFVADHWQYLGSMSVIALGTSGAVLALDRWALSYRRIGPVIGSVVLTGLGLLTWRQGHIYYNRETLWRDTLAKNPGCWMAHIDLGNVLLKQNKVSEAIGEYEWALQINPDYAEARYNLGVALEETGRVPEAIGSYEEALKLKPDYAEAHNNLGVALAGQRKFAEAIAEITAAVRLNPDYADAHYNIAILLAKQGKIDDAIAHLQSALKLEPGNDDFRRKLNELLQVDARPQIQ